MKLPPQKKGVSERFLRLIAYDPLRGVHPIGEHHKIKKAHGGRIRDNGGRFAKGGSVDVMKMADGGDTKPAFDPAQPFQSADEKPPFDPSMPFSAAPSSPDKGSMNALASGAAQGATAGFSDELRGLNEAGGAGPQDPASLGQTIKGAYRYFTGDKGAEQKYNEATARERAADETAKVQHPYLHMAGEIAGSLPAMAALPEAQIARESTGALKVAGKIAEGAISGGQYGALSGAGEGTDATSRITGAAEGAGAGIVGGGAAGAVGGIASEAIRPIAGAIRAARDPEKEAATRLTTALQADQDLIASGKAQGMSPKEWIAARARAEPVTLADLGSTNTQALLRSSANTSPEGRAILEKAFNDRFAGQTDRVADEVRGLVAGGANAGKTADQLVAEYDRARAPAYNLAYKQGANEITSPVIDRLTESPRFAKAMTDAESSVRDRAIVNGLIPPKPGVKNLQYWDAVKQELDGMASTAGRAGDNGTADVAGRMAKQLRDELDKQVPSYANARGIASQYFGESNALEAGRKLAGKRVDPQQISDVMRKMKPDERDLFREGYASDWANRVIGNISDTRDLTKAMFNSPNERARALAVFGPAGMDKMQSRMALETIMDGARKAMGNSTTARQLIEAGLAGGISGYETGWNPWDMAGAAGLTLGSHKVLGTAISSAAQKLIGKVDGRTARLVAELLTSDDPSKLQQGLRMAQKNPSIKQGLAAMASKIGIAGQQGIIRPYIGPHLGPMQGPVPASANEKQNQPPRVGYQ